jgi:hypothetical protein
MNSSKHSRNVTFLRQLVAFFLFSSFALAQNPTPKLVGARDSTQALIAFGNQPVKLAVGQRVGSWTLMQVLPARPSTGRDAIVVLEDFSKVESSLLFLTSSGILFELPKTAEPTWGDSTRYFLGRTLGEVIKSPTDLLGDQLLAGGGDPHYEEVASALPPIARMPTYGFVGTPENRDKIGFEYGGRTANFDPAPYHPSIGKIRDKGRVLDGLVGGYLPVMRFVYPESEHTWCEFLAFAPFRRVNESASVQPVWYRVARIEADTLVWVKYIDSYHPFLPGMRSNPQGFWRDLLGLKEGWENLLAGAMQVELPDRRLADMARFGLVREMMTRTQDFPHYGVIDRNYAGSEHDGFPDAFTVGTEAMIAWGLVDRAGRYIDNYFGQYVRDDGSLLYRGPETGQFGRMLTVLAQFVEAGGDPALLLKHRKRIDAVTDLLLVLRREAKELPSDNPAYGMIAGWSEADAALDAEPTRYVQPYFSNSTEAARGFRDLGRVWRHLGQQRRDASLKGRGDVLINEGESLEKDIQKSISRSLIHQDGETILPALAGVKEPFHVVVPRDGSDPQFRSYRAYMEMLHSGTLTKEQVRWITDYRSGHHDRILGLPTAYGYATGEMASFLSYGIGYGLIQHDFVPEALLLLWSDMAHGYTRGGWTAPETRNIRPEILAAPYATPAQLVVPLMTKWMLLFEDPERDEVWLARAVPRDWLENGKGISVKSAATRFGRVGFEIRSFLNEGRVEAEVEIPKSFRAALRLKLRLPEGWMIQSAMVNESEWRDVGREEQVIMLDSSNLGAGGKIRVVARVSAKTSH